MRIANILVSLACGFVLAACADRSPTGTVPSPNAAVVVQQATPVPFKLQCDCGNFVITTPDPTKPWQTHVALDGVCQVSHLGRAVVHIEQDADFIAWTVVGDETITAANGDKLYVHHSGPAGGDGLGNVWFGGPIVIQGGTGRFAGASGTGTYEGSASIPGNSGQYGIEAMIRYAAAERAEH